MRTEKNFKFQFYPLLFILLCFFCIPQINANELPEATQPTDLIGKTIPAWTSQKGKMVSPEDADVILRKRAIQKEIRWQRELEQRKKQQTISPQSSWQDSLLDFFFSSAEASTALLAGPNVAQGSEIIELARSLKNDPDLIYQYVRNNIAYEATFGEKKGALGTLLDQSGNAFDQSALMIELLKAAGYQASFIYGNVRLDFNDYKDWLGVDTAEEGGQYLANGGIPTTSLSNSRLKIRHVWVSVALDGNDYVFDPSIKEHLIKEPIDLSSIMGFTDSSFMSNALSGATQTTNYVQNINQSNIDNKLTLYTDNLISHIKSTSTSPTLEDIIGGQEIIKETTPLRQTSLSYQLSIIATWPTEIPIGLSTTLEISVAGINKLYRSSEIYGHRLTLFFNAQNVPQLRLDGQVQATGNVVSSAFTSIIFDIDHPYADSFVDVANGRQDIATDGQYFIVNSWGNVGAGIIDKRRKWLEHYRFQGNADDSEEVLGESLALVGYNWLAQNDRAHQIIDATSGTKTIKHHGVGIAGFNSSTYVDLPFNTYAGGTSETFFIGGIVSSALEHGVIEQTQGIEAVSTIELLNVANNAGIRVYELTQNNQGSIKPLLTGYSSAELDSYLNQEFKLIIPQSAHLTVGDWTGRTYLGLYDTQNSKSGAYIIGGGLSGGFGTSAEPVNVPQTGMTGNESLIEQAGNFIADPIDFASGQFVYDADDMVTGSGSFPFSLGLQRSYHSANRLKQGPFGLGWTHNFDITLSTSSNALQGMGKDSVIDAAGFIVASYVSTQLLQVERSLPRLMVSSIINKWTVDSFTDNQVVINAPGNNQQFIILPNGDYQPSPGTTAELSTDTSGHYHLRMKNGTELAFNSNNKIQSWQDANGNSLNFNYDSANKLKKVSNDVGRYLNFTYTGNRIQQVTDNTGRQVNYQYDGSGNLTRYNNTLSEQTKYEYDIAGRMTKVFLPETPTQALVINEYDALDRIKRQTNALGKDYDYYLSGKRSEEVDPYGIAIKTWYFGKHGKVEQQTDALGRTVFSDYDGEQRLVRQQLPEGNAIDYSYDQNHNLIQTRVQSKGANPSYLTTSAQYELIYNRPLQKTDARGKVSNLEYYSNSPNLKRILQPALTTGSRAEINYNYNSRGQITYITDPEGRVTKNNYDSAGKLTKTTADSGSGRLNLSTDFSYDAIGNIRTTTNPKGQTTEYTYDSERRLLSTESPAPYSYLSEIDYDKNGRIIEQRTDTGDALDPLQIVQSEYTLADKLKKITDAEGYITQFEYDDTGRLIKTIDAENRISENEYYDDGRLYRQYRNLSGTKITVAEYDYTANGQTNYIEDAKGNRTDYHYDLFDRLDRTTYPDGSYQQSSYDNNSNITRLTTRAGDMIDYDYDVLNRRIEKDLAGTADDVSYHYDLSGLTLSVTAAAGTHSYSYDTAGRQKQETQPDGKIIQQHYDANSNRSVLIYPDGYTLNYSYDALNRLERIDEINPQTQNLTTLASYDYIDRLHTQLSYANGITLSYESTIGGQLRHLEHLKSNNTLVSYDLLHNKVGELINRNISGTDYDWQPNSEQSTDYTSNELNQYDSIKFALNSYDSNGNFIDDNNGTRYSYDKENRMTAAITPQHNITYAYDTFGRRIQKSIGTQITRYSYDGSEVLAEYGNNGQMLARYVYGAGIDQPLTMERNGNRYYYHPDPQGSIAALSNSNGTVVQRYAYGPFGEGTSNDPYDNPYRYTARRYDEETGLYYYRARQYNPDWGRFLQADPIGYGDGLNLYAYVGNSPVSFVDPFGLTTREVSAANYGLINTTNQILLDYVPGNQAFVNSIGSIQNGDYGNAALWGVQSGLEMAASVATGSAINQVVGVGLSGSVVANRVGYHATLPEVAPLIRQNGFIQGTTPGRLGSGGTYVNNTRPGAIAEFQHHHPGVTPSVLRVEYNAGINASTNVAPGNYVNRLPFNNVNSISAPSVRLPGTINTNVLNNSVRIVD